MVPEIEELIVKLDRTVISEFAILTKDHNLAHRDKTVAQSQGFKDILAQGVLLHAYFEQFAIDRELTPTSYDLTFKEPAHPRDVLRFNGEKEGGSARFECRNKKGLVALCKVMLDNPPSFEEKNSAPAGSFNYYISKSQLESFHSLLKNNEQKRVPISLISSLIPASLFQVASDEDVRPEGIFRGFNIKTFRQPRQGAFNTEIYFLGEPKKFKDNLFYNLRGICYQEGKKVLSGDIRVLSKKK